MPSSISTNVNASGNGLVFQTSYSLDGTFASLTLSEQAALKTDVQQAEYDLSSVFSNSAILKVDIEAVNVPARPDGSNFIGSNEASSDVTVSLSSYFTALQGVATSSYQLNAVNAVRSLRNLGASGYVELPSAYARMLGLSNSGWVTTSSAISFGQNYTYGLSSSVDDSIFLNLNVIETAIDDQDPNTPNQSVVAMIEHELTEDAMGRTSGLLEQTVSGIGAVWEPADFFRVDTAGRSDLTADNGSQVFFSAQPGVQGPASSLQFNNSSGAGDFADWTTTFTSDPSLTDPFGPGDFDGAVGTESSTLSQTDIDLMNVLGWTISSASGATSPLSIALKSDTGASSTDKLTGDPTLTGAAAPNTTVTLRENGVTLGTATADPGGVWTFRPTLADGQHTVAASEVNGQGQTLVP